LQYQPFLVKKQPLFSRNPAALRQRFEECKAEIMQLDLVSQGSVTEGHPGAWRWTRKVKAKTVTVALSKEQAQAFRLAVAQHRRLEKLIDEMRLLSQTILLESLPGPLRRKPAAHPKSSLT
jgi:hypothetical protein